MAAGFMPGVLYFIWFSSKMLNDLYVSLKKNLDRKNDFKLILDSLEESIIIINDNKIDFVNDMFLNQFGDPIFRMKSNLLDFDELNNQEDNESIKIKIKKCR